MSEQQRDRDVRDTEAVREKCPCLHLFRYEGLFFIVIFNSNPLHFFFFFGVVTEKQESCHKSLKPRMLGRDARVGLR